MYTETFRLHCYKRWKPHQHCGQKLRTWNSHLWPNKNKKASNIKLCKSMFVLYLRGVIVQITTTDCTILPLINYRQQRMSKIILKTRESALLHIRFEWFRPRCVEGWSTRHWLSLISISLFEKTYVSHHFYNNKIFMVILE